MFRFFLSCCFCCSCPPSRIPPSFTFIPPGLPPPSSPEPEPTLVFSLLTFTLSPSSGSHPLPSLHLFSCLLITLCSPCFSTEVHLEEWRGVGGRWWWWKTRLPGARGTAYPYQSPTCLLDPPGHWRRSSLKQRILSLLHYSVDSVTLPSSQHFSFGRCGQR